MPGESTMAAPARRRHDLDWIRVGVFALLILYHVGLCYGTGNWLANSRHESRVVDMLLLGSHPWRLTILFVVSGAATAYIADRRTPLRLWLNRSTRLLLPLLFGVLVVVPPQVYLLTRDLYGNDESYLDFWLGRYLGPDPHILHEGRRYFLMYAMHLWFLMYLWLYSSVAAILCGLGVPATLRRVGEHWVPGLGLLAWPILFFLFTRQVLYPVFGEMTGMFGDWYNHVDFLAAFLFGFVFARPGGVWDAAVRLRRVALALALAGWACYAALYAAGGAEADGWDASSVLMRVAHPVERWSAVIAVLGYGRLYLDRDGPVLRYLTGAIFTYYIVHQTVTVIALHHLASLGLSPLIEATLLVGITVALCAVSYEIVRRIPYLHPFFGLSGIWTRAAASLRMGGARDAPAGVR